jgi:hypothetical protein
MSHLFLVAHLLLGVHKFRGCPFFYWSTKHVVSSMHLQYYCMHQGDPSARFYEMTQGPAQACLHTATTPIILVLVVRTHWVRTILDEQLRE